MFRWRGIQRYLLPFAAAFGVAASAAAQDAGADLRRNLTAMAQNPRSAAALIGAGRAALETGDANAALGFFARAAEAEPGNARAKAGMAQALVQLERASEALPLFGEAVRLGAPEIEIAADRGLAWDSLGYPGRAQADYARALRREDDPEIRRRLALSLAISGRREEALRLIDGQLRQRDRAALRTQVFILALDGDAQGAQRVARAAMPGGADALAPFLTRLARLSPSQKALAVHFGRFPGDGRAESFVEADSSPDPGALAMAAGTVPMGPARQGRPTQFASAYPEPDARIEPAEPLEADTQRRRPGADDTRLSAQIRPAPQGAARTSPRRPLELAELQTRRRETQSPSRPEPRGNEPAPAWPTPVLDERQSPGFTLVPQGRALGQAQPEPQPRPAPPLARPLPDFSIVTSAVEELPADDAGEVAPPVRALPVRIQSPPPRPESRPVRSAETRAPTRTRARPAPPASPARTFVQLATGERAGLTYTLRTFRERAPALLGGKSAWTAPVASTNRLLVGPFDSERAARSFVNQLLARDVPGLVWTSTAGQPIERLAAANDTRSASRRSEPEQRSNTRGASSRAQPDRRAGTRTATGSGRTQAAQRGAASRTASTRQPTARTSAVRPSRGTAKPQPRPSTRGRRSG